MRRKLSWPFAALVFFSFVLGAGWGFKLIRDRRAEEGRLVSEAKLKILAPPGVFASELLLEFQKREKIEVELAIETFPASLLRRALKSAPGQYDAALVFHYQVSALRAERRLASLYDTRVKFPISISPDFRKLPNDRNLMDTAPLLWGLLGTATRKDFDRAKTQIAFWPSSLIGLEDVSVQPNAFATNKQPLLGSLEELEARAKQGLGTRTAAPTGPLVVSHASLAFSPLKEAGLEFEALGSAAQPLYPLWILTLAALSDGDVERTRRFVKFLLEPAHNIVLVQAARAGATTLRDQNELAALPKILQSSYFRKFAIDKILLERDERIRAADEVLEQLVLGAGAKIAKSVAPARQLVNPTAAPESVSPVRKKVPAREPVDAPEGAPLNAPVPAKAPPVATPSEQRTIEPVPEAERAVPPTELLEE